MNRKDRTITVKAPRKRLYRLLNRVVFPVLLIAVAYFFNHAGIFAVREVRIEAPPEMNTARLENLFALEDLIGMNSFWVPYKRISKMMVSHPMVSSVEVLAFPPGRIVVTIEPQKPVTALVKPWGYYVLGANGQFIDTMPPYFIPQGFPLKFSNERILFDNEGCARIEPSREILRDIDISDRDAMLAMGYRDLFALREDLMSERDIPSVQYIGYDERYGLMLKCEKKPLILIGYGNDLMVHYTRAMKILTDTGLPYGEDKYIDIRYNEFQSANDIGKLTGLDVECGTPVDEDNIPPDNTGNS